jgi:hypothetical protein
MAICTRARTEFAKEPKTGHRDLSFLPLRNAFYTVFQLDKNILITVHSIQRELTIVFGIYLTF